MSTAGSGLLDFGPLLERPGFRADLLYFIRLAGNYAASIFADVRNRAPMKHRKAFDDWLSGQSIDPKLKSALTRHDAWFDALKADFTRVLDDMPLYLRDRLAHALVTDHVIPLSLRDFISALNDLIAYRHWLEHAEERLKKGESRPRVSDERLLEILGLMLLPFLGNHLLGRIRHHGLRARLPNRRVEAIAAQAKAIMDKALATRREASRFINGLKRRTSHEDIAAELERKRGRKPSAQEVLKIAKARKKKRADLESRKAALLRLYRRYFDDRTWPRYNLENFLIRFGFIGTARIKELEHKLGLAGQRGDFINAVEPAFMLAMDVALILHGWLTELEEAGVPIRKRKDMEKIHADAQAVPAIRNQIAHSGWFWAVEHPQRSGRHLGLPDMLNALFAALHHPAINDRAHWRNALLTRLEAALRPCRWAHVHAVPQPGDDPNRMPAPIRIKRWTAQRRACLADRKHWRIERRAALRRLAGAWMRDLAAVRREAEQI